MLHTQNKNKCCTFERIIKFKSFWALGFEKRKFIVTRLSKLTRMEGGGVPEKGALSKMPVLSLIGSQDLMSLCGIRRLYSCHIDHSTLILAPIGRTSVRDVLITNED